MKAAKASDLRDLVRLQQRGLDANGERRGDWDQAGERTVAAGLVWRTMGEETRQGRLQGLTPVVITLWASAVTRQVGAGWRAIDVRTGRIIDVKSDGAPSEDRAFLEFEGLVDAGGGGS